jgi:hypothetical protein
MEDDSKAPLLVFGGVALKVESAVHSPKSEVELVAVPIYDSPALTPAFREILNKTPWERLPTDCPHPAFVREVTGIVIGCGIIAGCEPMKMVDGKWATFPDFSQTAAEIMNLILMCGGKRPKPKTSDGDQGSEGGAP